VVLAAMDCDSTVRAAVNIKYRPETIDAVEKAGEFSVSSFNREDEPGQSSTMEWGTREAIRVHGSVPDIVYDRGGVGKEPMIRILGTNPAEVLFKLKKIIDWV
ncbi:MAG TPA: bifunctional hydroxymethylpyrimidine kinase/phosphomethylpyrimidine kinase, partial [Euryarchaeota archaeon]|nr:bifunctional hydroxymethylpyrimidine kinase/phosphomethylpyrimidine kinase [Euryarchaeota archaeon]